MGNPASELNEALDAIERLMAIFRIERFVYLVIAVLAAALFFFAAFKLFASSDPNPEHIFTILGSSGVATAVSVRVTYIFNKAFKIVDYLICKVPSESGKHD
jgi:hypothetical protein